MTNQVDVFISKMNETWMSVRCREQYMEMEISDKFSFMVANAQFDPRVKARKWDGIKRLYNRTHKRMYAGLLFELIKFLKKQGYSYTIDPNLIHVGNISHEDIAEIVKEVIKPCDNGVGLEPYDYQYDAVHWMLNSGRSISLAATSAGKSLCLYLAVRIYQLADELAGKQIIIIVPSKMLVEQLYGDFKNYADNGLGNWDVDVHCQRIHSDHSRYVNKQIIITTWQSLEKMKDEFIADAGAIFVDEVHTVRGPVLASILEKAVNCPIRHGMTGTLDGAEVNELSAQGLMGPCKLIVTAKENIDAGRATRININIIVFDYDSATKRRYAEDQGRVPAGRPGLKYQSEVNFINQLECRFEKIQQMVESLKGNTIILFDRVEDYGIPLYEDMKSRHENTFLIVGDVKAAEREAIRLNLEGVNDARVYATSNLMSTGVSIKNLHNMVYVSSTKAKVKLLQSIGRLMRLHSSKSVGNFIDIVDKLDYNGKPNYVLKHVEERVKQYSIEGHKMKFLTINLEEGVNNTLFDSEDENG